MYKKKLSCDLYGTDSIWWYNQLRHTAVEIMTTIGKDDTFDLMKINDL